MMQSMILLGVVLVLAILGLIAFLGYSDHKLEEELADIKVCLVENDLC